MTDWLKAALPAPLWRFVRGVGTALIAPISFTIRTGHWRSALTGKVVDREGNPIPWYSYPAIDFLSPKDLRGLRVLEFGGGHSTIWWVRKGATVVTIEPDRDWSHWIMNQVGAQVHYVPFDPEVRDMAGVEDLLALLGEFDVIVIDGHLRQECALASVHNLKPGGALLIDNFDAMDFSGICSRQGCSKIDFWGLCPDGSKLADTALLFWGDCALLNAAPTEEPSRLSAYNVLGTYLGN